MLEREDEKGRFLNLRYAQLKIDKQTLEYSFWPRETGRYRIRWEDGLIVWRTEPFEYSRQAAVRADILVRLRPPYISGVVVRPDGEPVPGVKIVARFVSSGSEYRSDWGRVTILNGFRFPGVPGNATATKADSEGRFVLVLPREAYDFWRPDANFVTLRAGSDEAGWSNDVSFEFDEATVADDVRLELSRGGAIDGLVTFEDEPARQELVAAYDGQGILKWTSTNSSGRFRIERLRPGSYMVVPLGQRPTPQIGFGSGGGDDDGLPPPHEFFELDVVVRDGEVTRHNIDLASEWLGGVAGAVAKSLASEGHVSFAISYGMILGGVPRTFSTLGGHAALENGSFTLENLLSGDYRIYAKDRRSSGAFVAEADVRVTRGQVASVILEPPTAALVVPVSGVETTALGAIRVSRVTRLTSNGRGDGSVKSEEWKGYRFKVNEEGLRLDGLPKGLVYVSLVSEGYLEAKSDPVNLLDGAEAISPPVTFKRGHGLRVRLEPPAGLQVPDDISFYVRMVDGAPFAHHTRRVTGEPVWVLSAFPAGVFTVAADAGSVFRTARATVTIDQENVATEILLRLEAQR